MIERRVNTLLTKSERAREKGKFGKALKKADKALRLSAKHDYPNGVTESAAMRSIALRVWANRHDNSDILTMAKHEMIGAVTIAEERAETTGDNTGLAIPYYNLAQLQEDLGELPEAVASYSQAVLHMADNPPRNEPNPAFHLADMKVHMTACEYKNGDITAIERAKQALEDLKNAEPPSRYVRDVCVSGGYMRMADSLRIDHPEEAREHLATAKQIIDSNPDLLLRRQQFANLEQKFA